jgi:GNAT superfamily N-acetyltransferase
MGMGIPKDAERHATQAALIQQGGVSREPAILIKFGNGYELLEGWHRTIQHFARYPDGYVGPAYVAVAQSRPGITESMAADQVLDYVKRAHAPEAFDIEYSITDHPEWELKNIPLSQLNLDPDGEEPDPYNRVNWVDDDKVQELIPQIEAILKRMPIVVDSQGWIIDGNHRAVAAAEAGLTSVPAYVPVKPVVAEGLDDNGINFQVQKGKNKFATTLSIGNNPVGVYQYNATTGRSIAEVYPEFKGKGLGKLLVLHAIYTATQLGLDFQEDESRTSEYDNVLDSLSSNGYIVDDDGYWYVTGEGEQYLKQSLKQDVAENFADGKNPGRKGLAKRSGVNTKASVSSLRKTAKNSSGEKQRMAHWLANMKAGRAKAKK